MTIQDLQETFARHETDEGDKFERVERKLSRRADLHAFLLLDMLTSGSGNFIKETGHGTVWLNVDIESLAGLISEEQVIDLIRCGVYLDTRLNSLYMMV